jgi:patatin-like phospholipase/acyl hydrolase
MKLLSLNGGGTGGYMSVSLIDKIECELKYPAYRLFDLVAGVSTGSIIAAAIGKGMPAKELKELYKKLSRDIFGNKSWVPWKPWYSSEKLEKLIQENINYTFEESKTRVVIYAAQISGEKVQPKFWKSWKIKDDTPATKAVVSSCSAPIYFAPSVINGNTYIDGGFVANNPSMCCLVEAIRLGADIDSLYNLNLSCGDQKGLDNSNKLNNMLKWIPQISKLITLAIRTGEESVEYQAHQLINFRNHVVTPSIDNPLDSLDFETMDKEVDKLWAAHSKEIVNQLQI